MSATRVVVSWLVVATAAVLPSVPALAQQSPEDSVVRALRDELARSTKELTLPGAPKPYFIAYRLMERHDHDVSAAFGQVVHDGGERTRILQVEVRVGDAKFDNGNFLDMGMFRMHGLGGLARTSLEDDYAAVRRDAWFASDRAYKLAAEALEKKRAARQQLTVAPDDPGSFSAEPTNKRVDASPAALATRDHAALAKALSRVFREHPGVQSDRVVIDTSALRRTFLSSEGSFVSDGTTDIRVAVECQAQADDGMQLKRSVSFRGNSVAELPKEAELVAEVRRLASELERARAAPIVDDFTGPVLFEGVGAAQLVHRLLASAVSGTPSAESGGASPFSRGDSGFANRIGQRVLAPGLRLEDDPTIDRVGALRLLGSYKADDEGVPAQKVVLIEDGVLKALLMSRTPAKGLPRSNGHGRGGLFGTVGAAIGNLILTGKAGLSTTEMRRRLLDQVRSARAPYGLIVRELDDGDFPGPQEMMMMMRGRGGRSVGVAAILGPDGKEQPVRGVLLPELDHKSLREVVAVGKELAVWHVETPQAAAGGGRATVVAPALLLKDVQVKRSTGPQPRPPLSQHPHFAGQAPPPK
jgi:TldD protein